MSNGTKPLREKRSKGTKRLRDQTSKVKKLKFNHVSKYKTQCIHYWKIKKGKYNEKSTKIMYYKLA